MKEYLIFCTKCNEYTGLGKYLPERRQFQGEYSLLHNRCTEDNELLCRFLMKHLGHHLKSLQSQTEDYSRVIRDASRYLDHEIDDYVQDSCQRLLYLEEERKRELSLSQVHFDVLENILEEEALSMAKIPTQTPAESQYWLGKEQGVRRAVKLLKEWREKWLT
ncbi:hypothetical protein [Ammoniphilus sp. 3BR4]|uniref:hypothetical protein n=1 Tax=Ammoniphilus sp. 3BR4 TaxID=3158265 RepID=UPI003466FCA5